MATPSQFVLGMVNHFGLNLERRALRRLVNQYMRDRIEMERESARQMLRQTCEDLKAKQTELVPQGWDRI